MHGAQQVYYYGESSFVAVINFFRFFGDFCYSGMNLLLGRTSLESYSLFNIISRSGLKLLFPLLIITALLGFSIVLNIYHFLSPFNLQHNVLLITQEILVYDLLPFLIGLMLSMQSGFNLINARIKKLKLTTTEVMRTYIIPMMIANNFSALILYVYAINIVFISIYFSLSFLLNTDIYEYLFHLRNTLTSFTIIYSIFKVVLYCTLVSLIVGYYYYEVALGHLSIRKAMSRIITRSFLWLALSSVSSKFLGY